MTHKIFQEHTIESSRLRLSRSPEKRAEAALSFGRDNRVVLESILGYSVECVDSLIGDGVIGPDSKD